MADLATTLKDAAYVGIGFGVLTVQRAQVQRQELKKQLETSLEDAKGGFSKLSGTVEERVKAVEERLEAAQAQLESAIAELETNVEKALDELAARLPEQARAPFDQARSAAREATSQLRARVAA